MVVWNCATCEYYYPVNRPAPKHDFDPAGFKLAAADHSLTYLEVLRLWALMSCKEVQSLFSRRNVRVANVLPVVPVGDGGISQCVLAIGVSAPRHVPCTPSGEPLADRTPGELVFDDSEIPGPLAKVQVVEVAGWATSTVPRRSGMVKEHASEFGGFSSLGGVLQSESGLERGAITSGHWYSHLPAGTDSHVDVNISGDTICRGTVSSLTAVVRNFDVPLPTWVIPVLKQQTVKVGVDAAVIDLDLTVPLSADKLEKLKDFVVPHRVTTLDDIIQAISDRKRWPVCGVGARSAYCSGIVGFVPSVVKVRRSLGARRFFAVHTEELESQEALRLLPIFPSDESRAGPVFNYGDSGAFVYRTGKLIGEHDDEEMDEPASGRLVGLQSHNAEVPWGEHGHREISFISLACPWGATLTVEAVQAELSRIKSLQP